MILNENGEVLLLKRSPTDEFHPNTWCLPGGGVDFGKEGISEGAYRELKEEVGIEGINLSFEKEAYNNEHDLNYLKTRQHYAEWK